MVNDLLSDPCAYGQRKKSVDACLFAPNESPILRILGMNNRNKITFKMIHLTVDAWRLQWLQSFPTAHISHLQQARWFHTGGPWCCLQEETRFPLTNMDLYSAPGPNHACAPAVRRPRCVAKSAWICVSSNFVCMGGCSDYEEYFFFF